MNKRRVETLIPEAYQVLRDVEIVYKDKDQIEKGFAGQISTFGASMMTGSVLATIAFFSNKNGANVDRPKILKGIELLITNSSRKQMPDNGLFGYVQQEISKGNEKKVKEELIDCAVALKLAMNLYELVKGEGETS